MIIHHEFLWQDMDDLLALGEINSSGSIYDTVNVILAYFTVFYADNTRAVKALDVAAGNTNTDSVDFAASHFFSLLHCHTD
jgi:hypothetical protein